MRVRLALIGFGGVNRALVTLLTEPQHLAGHDLLVTAVADPRFGCAYASDGLNLAALANLGHDAGALLDLGGGRGKDNDDLAVDDAVDALVEASVTNPADGEPALSLCRRALAAGKSVVTTNKGPVAFGLAELLALGARNNAFFRFEGAVMSGTPVLRAARACFPGMLIREFRGILNGTSNFVLGRMEGGVGLVDAVREAQAAGYAETDPSADLDGGDVRLKVAILANVLFGTNITPADVTCRGITALTPSDIKAAHAEGLHWKLIGSGSRAEDGTINAKVEPVRVASGDPLASIGGAVNALTFIGVPLGATTIVGPGAGPVETAYAVLSDLIEIAESTI